MTAPKTSWKQAIYELYVHGKKYPQERVSELRLTHDQYDALIAEMEPSWGFTPSPSAVLTLYGIRVLSVDPELP